MPAYMLYALIFLILVGCSQLPSSTNQSQYNNTIEASQNNRPQLVVQLSHASPITDIALSADGRLLVTASWDETLRLWDAITGQELRRFEGHSGVVQTVVFSANSELLLSGGKDNTARLWNISTGNEILRLTNHTAPVTAVAFSTDGKFLLTGSDDMTARVWNSTTGKEYRKFEGHASEVFATTFSPNGRYAVVGSHSSAYLWNIESGKLIRRFDGHQSGIRSVAVSPDSQFILTGSNDHSARLWDIEKGQEIQQYLGHQDDVFFVEFSSDGKFVLTGSKDRTARKWNLHNGEELSQVKDQENAISAVAFSPNHQFLFSASDNIVQVWNFKTANRIQSLKGNSSLVSDVAFSPDGKYILISNWDNTARLWETTSGQQVKSLTGHTGDVRAVNFSSNGKLVLTGSRDGSALLWETISGSKLHRFKKNSAGIRSVAFSPNGHYILTGSDDGSVWLWKANKPYKKIRKFGSYSERITSAVFSSDSHTVLISSDNTASLWDIKNNKAVKHFHHKKLINAIALSPDRQLAATASWDKTTRIWNLNSGKQTVVLTGHSSGVSAVTFSPDGQFLVTGSEDKLAILWDVKTGKEVRRFSGHLAGVTSVAFSPDGQFILTGSRDQTARLWHSITGVELCALINFQDNDWAVVDKSGRFDAANGGDVEGLHWVIGRNQVALNQLKERYYDPGLLAKKLGRHPEPEREVAAFENPKLYPEVTVKSIHPNNPIFRVTLANQGGGIGKVLVSVNGKEITDDARGEKINPKAEALTLNIDLTDNPFLNPGEENFVTIRAFNAEGYLSSRGVKKSFQVTSEIKKKEITLWAILGGISDYEGDHLDLHFAEKDAQDMAKAITLGGQRLFDADRVKVKLLTTATKKNFVDAFAETNKAKPWDILFIYFAGHGIAIGDDYYFLTQEARSTELSDPSIRKRVTISSTEMIGWLKQSPALKQVMILDTCQAGAAARKLVEQREITSGQVRALERLKDRTGFHVLMGSAADAASYEASQYEQGLLTHALLKGMKGSALRDDEFIDVSKLFQYAADEVPILAANIGGIQRPRIAAPKGTSFSVGQLIEEDRAAIPLSLQKPLLLQPMFLNKIELSDNLQLTTLVRKRLRDKSYHSSRNGSPSLSTIYLDTDQVPNAIQPTGTYVVKGKTITVNIVLSRDTEKIAKLRIHGLTDNLSNFIDSIVNAIYKKIVETI